MLEKILILSILLVGVSCRYISPNKAVFLLEDNLNAQSNDEEDSKHDVESFYPNHLSPRVRRQVHGVMNTNPDGSTNIMGQIRLDGNDKNVLNAIGGISGAKPGGSYGATSGGLALANVNGHGVSISGEHIPDFGNKLTAAGKTSLFDNDKHVISANAFATRNIPKNPVMPNSNTYGASLDYNYNNKVGASLGASRTPVFQRNDYSANMNLNLFKNPTSSLDFNAGARKSVSPFIRNKSWQPSFGFSYSKYF